MLTENDRDGFLLFSDPLATVVTLEGAEGGAEVTTAVVVDAADAEPPALVAVTTIRRVAPTSAVLTA
jgi:hypothetical protein